jgi:predicted ATP-grasp superfamily ATP-dependent carboligase
MARPDVPTLILCAASVRSLAQAAIKVGIIPFCIDFFGDSDLRDLLDQAIPDGYRRLFCRIRNFSELPEEVAMLDPSVPLVWAGGLENELDVLQQICGVRPVPGFNMSALAKVRDPFQFAGWFPNSSVRVPDVRHRLHENQRKEGSQKVWLQKHYQSGGGRGIHRVPQQSPLPGLSDPQLPFSGYFQEFVSGLPASAIFSADGQTVRSFGCAAQLSGWPELGADGFLFCGNYGPLEISPQTRSILQNAAATIAARSGLRGVFGMDFILKTAADQQQAPCPPQYETPAVGLCPDESQREPCRSVPWLLEVNPRITASHEIYEYSTHNSLLLEHLRCCVTDSVVTPRSDLHGWSSATFQSPLTMKSKLLRLILYARQDIPRASEIVSAAVRFCDQKILCGTDPDDRLWLADIPASGEAAPAGTPVCSLYVAGDGLAKIVRRLQLASTIPDFWDVLQLCPESIARRLWNTPELRDAR